MCMLMLWSQIIYGHCTASISPNIVRFYGARTAPGRRHEESCDFFYQFLDILRCPVMLRFYFKFHGARTAFGRVNEGKMTSAGHRTVSGWSFTTPAGHRTTSYGARAGTGRCFHIQTPDGARMICDHAGENS